MPRKHGGKDGGPDLLARAASCGTMAAILREMMWGLCDIKKLLS